MFIMNSKFLRWLLLLVCLFATQGCDNKNYVYTAGPYWSSPEASTVVEPFVFKTQVSFSDGKRITVAVPFLRNNNEKHKQASLEIACAEFEAFVEGKKLKPIRVYCPTGKELLERMHIEADFATPDGRPKQLTVSVPTIKVTALDSPNEPAVLAKSLITFTRQEYKRSFGLH